MQDLIVDARYYSKIQLDRPFVTYLDTKAEI
jgi:hypothetical protein